MSSGQQSLLDQPPKAVPATLTGVPPFINVAAYLPKMAQQQPEALAVALANGHDSDGTPRFIKLSCQQLNQRCDRIAHGLEKIGIGKGVRTVLMVKPGPSFFALTFALFKVGAIPVMVDPGMGIKNLKTCLDEAEPQAFIGIPRAHLARLLLGWGKNSIKINLTVGTKFFWGGYRLYDLESDAPETPYQMQETAADQTAAILFTSGSTGVPKGAVYHHGVFAAQVQMMRDNYGIRPGEIDLSTFPLFALFGAALGMASVIPEMNASKPGAANPRLLVEAIDEFKCTNMFASPALIEKIGRYCDSKRIKLAPLKRVISAGAPASIPSIERFAKALGPGVEVFSSYGATEAMPLSALGSATILRETRAQTERGGGVCVGHPFPGLDIAIIGVSDDPIAKWSDQLRLATGEIGEIVVKGPIVTRSYYKREQSTLLAKISDTDSQIRHRMGDVGYLDELGRLWMCGRKSHRVTTANQVMFSIPCEAVFNKHPQVFRSALVGVQRQGETIPVICIERERGVQAQKREDLRAELIAIASSHQHTRSIKSILFHPAFPMDVRHNAKIFREQLARWAQRELR